jgi:hypothetical protein
MTAGPTIDYEALAQEAMRGVVRSVLAQTAKSGLAGDHHFYISFDTEAAGVSLSKRLKEKYPREMTIVLQHRFWDLAVADDRFEVKLTFDGIPERLVVPFAAIKVFFDPSVRYGLQFEDPGLGPDPSAHAQAANALDGATRTGVTRASQTRKTPRPPRKPRPDHGPTEAPSHPVTSAPAPPAGAAYPPAGTPTAANGAPKDAAPRPEPEKGGAQIVSLDKFRKK